MKIPEITGMEILRQVSENERESYLLFSFAYVRARNVERFVCFPFEEGISRRQGVIVQLTKIIFKFANNKRDSY